MVTEQPDLSEFASRRVSYPSDSRDLAGYVSFPERDGPLPGLVFLHGSAGLQPGCFAGIQALVEMGYAVFAATRRGHNGNAGPSWYEATLAGMTEGGPLFAAMGEQLVQALRDESRDALAALTWLRQHPRVNPRRIGVVGQSFGGVVALFVAAQPGAVRAGVSFAGPSITWPHVPALQVAMAGAAQAANAPLFLIQAENDHSLAPIYAVAAELGRCGKPHEVRVYPRHGASAMDGHGLFRTGSDWWRDDVQRFLAR